METLPENKIKIEWVPSHQGIKGNEKADQLANKATESQNINSIPKPRTKLKQQVKKHFENTWSRDWRRQDPTKIEFKPNPGPTAYLDEKRRDQTTLTRIRLKVTRLTHSHYFTRTAEKQCQHCNTKLSLQHLFIDCPLMATQRRSLIQQCNLKQIQMTLENIVSPPFPASLLIKFLKDSNMYKEI